MRAHVRQAAIGILPIFPPSRKMLMDALGAENLVVTALGRWAQPEIPVGSLRNRLLGQIAWDRWLADAHADRLDLADAIVADELHGLPKYAAVFGSLLTSGLKHNLVLGGGVYDTPPLTYCARQRLFAVNV